MKHFKLILFLFLFSACDYDPEKTISEGEIGVFTVKEYWKHDTYFTYFNGTDSLTLGLSTSRFTTKPMIGENYYGIYIRNTDLSEIFQDTNCNLISVNDSIWKKKIASGNYKIYYEYGWHRFNMSGWIFIK